MNTQYWSGKTLSIPFALCELYRWSLLAMEVPTRMDAAVTAVLVVLVSRITGVVTLVSCSIVGAANDGPEKGPTTRLAVNVPNCSAEAVTAPAVDSAPRSSPD
jgi:hypothetical protein